MSLPAGDLRAWLGELAAALRGEGDTDVACGTCVACCSAAQFVHIGPDETDALAHIPAALLVPAPGLPKGNVVLGYDEHGRCPMLGEHGCTIYRHRPRTCRTYDCRVFAAAGVYPGEPAKAAIAERARQWEFAVDAGSADLAARLRDRAAQLRSAHPEAPATAVALRACFEAAESR